MGIEIKEMITDEEIKGKAYVYFFCWHDTYPGIVSQKHLDDLTPEKCEKIAFDTSENVIIAKDNNRVVGFIGYGVKTEDGIEVGEIMTLYVLSEYRGKGIGSRLMCAGLERLNRCSLLRIWVVKGNDKAIRFYEKFGFYPDGEEKTSEKVGADGVRLTKRKSTDKTDNKNI